jgi:ankyrin repeat protein
MTAKNKNKAAFNRQSAPKKLVRKYSAEEMQFIETQIIFFNAAKNNVMDTFERMPLERQHAVMNRQNKEGTSPLMNACRNGHEHVVRHLLGLGVDTTLFDGNGWTALTHAASRGSVPIMAQLLDAGADIDWQDKERWTPLMEAASKNNPEAVALLLERGCGLVQRGVDGMNATEIATDGGFPAIAGMIEKARAARALKAELDSLKGLPQDISVARPLKVKWGKDSG